MLALLAVASTAHAGPARPGTHFVLILDNSGSMVSSTELRMGDGSKRNVPPADPDRLSILATLILTDLVSDDDRLDVLAFEQKARGPFRQVATTRAAIQGLLPDAPTLFRGPLAEARQRLQRSDRTHKVILLVTDGMPSDKDLGPNELATLVGKGSPDAPNVMSLAWSGEEIIMEQQKHTLESFSDYYPISSPAQLVHEFTRAFASARQSRPQSGALARGDAARIEVGRYVGEVYVIVTSAGRSGPFKSALTTGAGRQASTGAGTNACAFSGRYPDLDHSCRKPENHYEVYRLPHNPEVADTWTLRIEEGADSRYEYGVIQVYDLVAELTRPLAGKRAGEEAEFRARLVYQGVTFNDPAFFGRDGFEASVQLGDVKVPLTVGPDGWFTGAAALPKPGAIDVEARFRNTWMDRRSPQVRYDVGLWDALEIVIHPAELDFGSWPGTDSDESRCIVVDFSGSTNADKIPLHWTSRSISLELAGSEHTPAVSAPGPVTIKPAADGKASICVVSPGCCGDEASSLAAAVVVSAVDEHYADRAVNLPVRYSVEATPFWVCWWKEMVALLLLLFLIWVINGFVSPRNFEPELQIRLASKERSLARASGRRLAELPGGKRGFYRHAAVYFDAAGSSTTRRKPHVLGLVAGRSDVIPSVPAGGLERRSARTRKWESAEAPDGQDYVSRNKPYRIGDLYWKLS